MALIVKLNQTNPRVSEEILATSLASYHVEAVIISAIEFPPLHEKIKDIQSNQNLFFGIYIENSLAGIIELELGTITEICRLVVHPHFFRKGIATLLLQKAISFDMPCKVATARKNIPAINLYNKYGFIEISSFYVQHELELVVFML